MRRTWLPILGAVLALAAMGVLGSVGSDMAPVSTARGSVEWGEPGDSPALSAGVGRPETRATQSERGETPPDVEEMSSAANRYATLGSAPLAELREERDGVVSLRRIMVAPDGDLRLSRLGGAGLLTVESGRLEVMRQNDAVQLKRGLVRSHSAPPGLSRFPVANAGDHFVLGPGADLLLHNPGAAEAEMLVVYVLINPSISATDLASVPAPRRREPKESVSP